MIDGVLRVTNNTFARFFNSCSYNTYAIGNNPTEPGAVHPVNIIGTVTLNVQPTSLASSMTLTLLGSTKRCACLHYSYHFVSFVFVLKRSHLIAQDCIDMDCDGPKHALVRDLDGTFVGTSPLEGSVVPFAEIR